MTVTTTEARHNLFKLVKKSIKGHVPIEITSREGEALLVSKEDYEGLLETLELLSIPGLKKSLDEAEEDIKAGRVKPLKEIAG